MAVHHRRNPAYQQIKKSDCDIASKQQISTNPYGLRSVNMSLRHMEHSRYLSKHVTLKKNYAVCRYSRARVRKKSVLQMYCKSKVEELKNSKMAVRTCGEL